MNDQIAVSPLLDGFTIGTPVADHYGVCCYPAVKENSQRRFIVKAISVPPSQTQLDALLITGAYQDPAQAADYFRAQADQLLQEAELLRRLSRLQGFVPFEGCQAEPMQGSRVGYRVYLLSGFRLSLERYMHRHTVSHLEAVNLGIDICAALSACRKEGMLYIDLKPSNIYISNKKEYKIGDLGFTPLASMKYAPMPEKYRSCYTAPELLDDLSVLNETADTYALGMILYQIFNNGSLPQDPTKLLPQPATADEEMTGILQKACAPDPADRFQDPAQMGQALIDYMQRGTINDVPIMEPISAAPDGSMYQTTKFPVPQAEEAPAEDTEQPPQEEAPQEADPIEEAPEVQPAETEEAPVIGERLAEEVPEIQPEPKAEFQPEPEAEIQPEPEAEEAAEIQEEGPQELTTAEIEAAAAEEFSRLSGFYEPEQPQEQPPAITTEELDQELTEMNKLLRASEQLPKKEPKPQPHVEPVVIKPPKKKRSAVGVLFTVFFIVLLLACSVWGFIYYKTEYLQTVNGITIQEDSGRLTVLVDAEAQESLLTVVCTDPYGNSFTQNVRGGKAEFTKLTPGTFYNIQVQVSGLHKLTEPVSQVYTTEAITNVAAFTAAVGPQDGSVALSMVVEGHEPEQWQVFYSAEGEPELAKTFTGHSVTVDNLTIGKAYTFRLELVNGGSHTPAGGQNTAQFTPIQVIGVRDLAIVSCTDGALTVQWSNTTSLEPEYWWVRCAGDGYDQTQEVTETQAVFTGISSDKSYTVEVCAKGMNQTSRVTVSANPLTLRDFQVDESDPQRLTLSWQYDGTIPEEAASMVTYTLDNSTLPSVVMANGTSAQVAPRIPGAVYHFTFQAGTASVFNGTQVYTCPDAPAYVGNGTSSENITCRLLETPEDENWNYTAISSNSSNHSFPAGKPLSAVLQSTYGNYLNDEDINILYVFRDAALGASAELVAEANINWHDLWNEQDSHFAELDLPLAPTRPGDYTLDIYFNGMALASAQLTIY